LCHRGHRSTVTSVRRRLGPPLNPLLELLLVRVLGEFRVISHLGATAL